MPKARRIQWHKEDHITPWWYGELDGVKVAEAAMNGRQGVDHYPWDWWLTAAGVQASLAIEHTPYVKHTGVCESLRSCKDEVSWAILGKPQLQPVP